jgi:RimJ/RimL family protein N-acetyltransferase
MLIETARLRLQPHSPADLLALMESAEAFHRSFGVPAAEGFQEFLRSGDVSEKYLKLLRTARDPDPWVHGWAVIERTQQLVIGSVGFKGPPDSRGTVEISYGIVPAFQRRGYATEAARALIAFARQHPATKHIRAHTLPARNASTGVLTKLGFMYAGEVIDPEDGNVWAWELPNSHPATRSLRVVLPFHLRNLARVEGEVQLEVPAPVTIAAVLDALEARFPVLRGTIRDHGTLKRRPFIRFFACKEDLSLDPPETPLPEAVVNGTEPFLVVGAMAGG